MMLRYSELPCNLFMHLALASYGNRLVLDKARAHENAILVKKIKHLKFNNISHLKQAKPIFKPSVTVLSRVNSKLMVATSNQIEISKFNRLGQEINRYSSMERPLESLQWKRSHTDRACSTIKPQSLYLHCSQRSKDLTNIIHKTKSINLTLSVEQQQNQKFTCRLWKQRTKLDEYLFMIEVLRCKNDYLLCAVWEQKPTVKFQVRVDETEGSKLLTQIDYDYRKLCSMLSFKAGALYLDFQLKNDSQMHHFRFCKRRQVHSPYIKSQLKCLTSPTN